MGKDLSEGASGVFQYLLRPRMFVIKKGGSQMLAGAKDFLSGGATRSLRSCSGQWPPTPQQPRRTTLLERSASWRSASATAEHTHAEVSAECVRLESTQLAVVARALGSDGDRRDTKFALFGPRARREGLGPNEHPPPSHGVSRPLVAERDAGGRVPHGHVGADVVEPAQQPTPS